LRHLLDGRLHLVAHRVLEQVADLLIAAAMVQLRPNRDAIEQILRQPNAESCVHLVTYKNPIHAI
jgi:hypothetical protein